MIKQDRTSIRALNASGAKFMNFYCNGLINSSTILAS